MDPVRYILKSLYRASEKNRRQISGQTHEKPIFPQVPFDPLQVIELRLISKLKYLRSNEFFNELKFSLTLRGKI